jgi:hypothetical protein
MNRLVLRAAIVAALGMGAALAHADSFTYHGTLQDAGRPANGRYDIQLTLYSKQSGGTVLAGPVTLSGVTVSNGNFSTNVDFGQSTAMTSEGWVGVKVSPAGNNSFVALTDRSPVAPEGCTGAWTLDGNAAIPSGSYLGTSDANNVYIKANSGYVAYFQTNGAVGLAYPDSVSGQYSTAIGYDAGTSFDGSTVIGGYSDAAFGSTVRDTATNQFIVAAEHGVGINTGHGADGGGLYDELTIAPSSSLPAGNTDVTLETPATGSSYAGFNIQADPTGYFYIMGLYNTGAGLRYDPIMYFNYFSSGVGADIAFNTTTNLGALTVGDASHVGGGAYLSSGGVWTNASSRTFKDGFGSVDVGAVLEKLVSMPMQTWFYKQSHDEGRHIGPFAEDFAAAFGYGQDDKHIATVDESGVTIAAIQGLNKKVETDNATLKQENAELRTKLDSLSARLDQLESHKGE